MTNAAEQPARQSGGRRRPSARTVLVIGVVVTGLAVLAVPQSSPDDEPELQQFRAVDKRVGEIETRMIHGVQARTTTMGEFADTIEREILPPWIEARERIKSRAAQPGANRKKLLEVLEYARCRQESWRLFIEGVREQNPEKLQRAGELRETAQRMALEYPVW